MRDFIEADLSIRQVRNTMGTEVGENALKPLLDLINLSAFYDEDGYHVVVKSRMRKYGSHVLLGSFVDHVERNGDGIELSTNTGPIVLPSISRISGSSGRCLILVMDNGIEKIAVELEKDTLQREVRDRIREIELRKLNELSQPLADAMIGKTITAIKVIDRPLDEDQVSAYRIEFSNGESILLRAEIFDFDTPVIEFGDQS